MVWYSHLFKNFPVCCDPHKDFDIVHKAEVDVFLALSFFFDNPVDVGNLVSGSSAFSKYSLNMWKFTIYIPPWRILSITLLVCELSAIVW